MPLNGSDVASKPAGTTAVTGTTIESAKYNSAIDDIYSIFNTVRTIATGHTGASTVAGVISNLGLASGIGLVSKKGADIASASTVDLSTATGNYIDITGTTTITSFGTVAAGQVFVLQFDGALTLTHNATSLILPGGANITTAAGDVAVMVSEGSGNWRCANYLIAAKRPAQHVWEHIDTQTASTDSTVTFTGLSAYRTLRATIYTTVSTDNTALFAQTSVSGTFFTTDSGYSSQVLQGFGSTVNTALTPGMRVTPPIGNAGAEAAISTVMIHEFNQNNTCFFEADTFCLGEDNSLPIKAQIGGTRNDANARDGLRFIPGGSTGTGTMSGFITLEGIRG